MKSRSDKNSRIEEILTPEDAHLSRNPKLNQTFLGVVPIIAAVAITPHGPDLYSSSISGSSG